MMKVKVFLCEHMEEWMGNSDDTSSKTAVDNPGNVSEISSPSNNRAHSLSNNNAPVK